MRLGLDKTASRFGRCPDGFVERAVERDRRFRLDSHHGPSSIVRDLQPSLCRARCRRRRGTRRHQDDRTDPEEAANPRNQGRWRLDWTVRRRARVPQPRQFRRSLGGGHTNCLDRSRTREHEPPERVGGDLEQIASGNRRHRGGPRLAGQQRHLTEESAVLEPEHFLSRRLEGHFRVAVDDDKHRVARLALANDGFALEVMDWRGAAAQLLPILHAERGENLHGIECPRRGGFIDRP